MHSVLSLLLVHSFLSLDAQGPEGDTLKKHSFYTAPYGSFHYVRWPYNGEGMAFEKGIEFRGDIALGDAGSGLALGLSASHFSHYWKDRYRKEERMRGVRAQNSDIPIHIGYFTRIRPFKWQPRITEGVSKLRFEYLRTSQPLNPYFWEYYGRAGHHAIKAGFHHARSIGDPFWVDFGVRVAYMDQWPGITAGGGNQTLFSSFSAGLSVGLQIRSGEKGAYP